MNQKKIAALLVAVTAVLAVGLYLAHGPGAGDRLAAHGAADGDRPDKFAGAPVSDSERLAQLDRRLARLEAALLQKKAPQVTPTEMQAQLARDAEASQQRAHEQRKDLEARFAANSSRGGSDRQAEGALSRSMGDATLLQATDPPLSDDIACRGDMCRMQFVFADSMAADNWANFYPLAIAESIGQTSVYTDTNADGTVSVLIFGGRRQADR